MDDVKHTPGPWRPEKDGHFGRFTIYSDGAHDVPHFAVARDVEPEDAPLLGAAPDLLAALVELCFAARFVDDEAVSDARDMADAAIAKATGR